MRVNIVFLLLSGRALLVENFSIRKYPLCQISDCKLPSNASLACEILNITNSANYYQPTYKTDSFIADSSHLFNMIYDLQGTGCTYASFGSYYFSFVLACEPAQPFRLGFALDRSERGIPCIKQLEKYDVERKKCGLYAHEQIRLTYDNDLLRIEDLSINGSSLTMRAVNHSRNNCSCSKVKEISEKLVKCSSKNISMPQIALFEKGTFNI